MTTPATKKPTNSRSVAPALRRQALSQSKAPDVDLRIRGFLTPLGAYVAFWPLPLRGRFGFGFGWRRGRTRRQGPEIRQPQPRVRCNALSGGGNVNLQVGVAVLCINPQPVSFRPLCFGAPTIIAQGVLASRFQLRPWNPGASPGCTQISKSRMLLWRESFQSATGAEGLCFDYLCR